METAAKWCVENPGWEYTGVWNNRRSDNGTGEISQFEVRKLATEEGKAVEATTAEGAKTEDSKVGEGKEIDQK